MTVGLVNAGDRLLRVLLTAVGHVRMPGKLSLVMNQMVIQTLVTSTHHNGYGTKNEPRDI